MNTTRSLKVFIAALLVMPLLATATGTQQGQTSTSTDTTQNKTGRTADSTRAGETGKAATNNKATEQRDKFVEQITKQLDQMEERLSQLKKDRDAQPKKSAQFQQLDSKVNAMEAKLKEARDNLSFLSKATAGNWKSFQPKVNANLAELRSMSGEKAAE